MMDDTLRFEECSRGSLDRADRERPQSLKLVAASGWSLGGATNLTPVTGWHTMRSRTCRSAV